jgi:cell division protein FtsQ
MKKGLRIAIIAAAACLLAFLILMIFMMNGNRKRELTCGGVNVEFADGYNFVTPEDIEGYLDSEYGAYIGQRLDSVDLAKVEKILDNKSAILKTEAYTTPDGMLNVKVYQREPVVRFQKGGNGFYADEKGFLFPLQSNYTSQVPIIDGAVPLTFESGYKGEPVTEKEKEWLSGIIELAAHMKATKTWAENISQISVRANGDLVMVPRQGKEVFIFGPADDFEEKFSKMEKYYTSILPEKGEGFYSTVNVKYKGQIICRK